MGNTYQPSGKLLFERRPGTRSQKRMGCPEGARQPVQFDQKRKRNRFPCAFRALNFVGPIRAALEDELALGLISPALNRAICGDPSMFGISKQYLEHKIDSRT